MSEAQRRSWIDRVGRAVLPLVLIALFFFAFVVVLNSTFPFGASLSSMVRYGGLLGGDTLPSMPDLPALGRPRAAEPLIAHMISLERTVRHRSPDSVAWAGAYQGMALENRSSVQTLASSGAVLDFQKESRLVLGENTLAVVRKFERDPVSRVKRAVILVLNGELRGSIAPSGGDDVSMQITTASAQGRILGASAASGKKSEFRVSENPDRSSTFSVYEGEAEVTAAGRTVRVTPGYTVTVHPSRPPGTPARLPDAPAPVLPADGETRFYRSIPPALEFTWTAEQRASEFRFEIARDADFEDIVHRAGVGSESFEHGNLVEGEYWWRVATVRDWAQSDPSAARRIRIVRDESPPELRVKFPDDFVPPGPVVLSGRSEPGARVFAAGLEVLADAEGSFTLAFVADAGLQSLVVQAMDPAGNVAHVSALVTAGF